VSETDDGKEDQKTVSMSSTDREKNVKIEIERPTQNIGDSRVVTRQMEVWNPTEREGAKGRFTGPSCPEACEAGGGSNEPRER
jgi:hypothetical protein